MRTYWDASALLDAILEIENARQTFDNTPEKLTRSHTLAETFSTSPVESSVGACYWTMPQIGYQSLQKK